MILVWGTRIKLIRILYTLDKITANFKPRWKIFSKPKIETRNLNIILAKKTYHFMFIPLEIEELYFVNIEGTEIYYNLDGSLEEVLKKEDNLSKTSFRKILTKFLKTHKTIYEAKDPFFDNSKR